MQLYLLEGGRERLLLDRGARGISWQPGADRITFVARRGGDKAAQVWAISPGDGKVVRVTEIPGGLSSYQWRPDGKALAYTATDPLPAQVAKAQAAGFRHVVVDEDYPRCSVASDISALVAEEAFDYLDAPPKRVTAPHASVPYSLPLEMAFLPDKERVLQAALAVLE